MNTPEPIRQALMIEADQRRTFEAFARKLAKWWPAGSGRRRRTADVRVDEHAGRIYQVGADGVEREWAVLTSWRPPHAFSFIPTSGTTGESAEIALRFQRLGPALTRVVVEHRGWEHLSGALYERDTIGAGGWLSALRSYAAVFETDGPPAAPPQRSAD